MGESVEALERRIDRLRGAVREAVLGGDRERAAALRRDLKQAEQAWEDALAEAEGSKSGGAEGKAGGSDAAGPRSPDRAAVSGAVPLLPLREQVHEALSLLTVPASPRLIATVHEAFFASTFLTARLTSLKRDEERSFRIAPFARPYYICAALTADLLAPSRGLLAISTMSLERRVIGPLSPRVDFLTAAMQIADAIGRLPEQVPAAQRLLWRFAASIPGAADSVGQMDPHAVARAAAAELSVHESADRDARRSAATRARNQLDDAEQLFGARLQSSPGAQGRRGN